MTSSPSAVLDGAAEAVEGAAGATIRGLAGKAREASAGAGPGAAAVPASARTDGCSTALGVPCVSGKVTSTWTVGDGALASTPVPAEAAMAGEGPGAAT